MLKDNLRYYRQKMGISAKKMSELLQVTYGAYQHYENRGNQPPLEVLCKMADILGVTTDTLLGRTANDKYSIIAQSGYTVKKIDTERIEITNKETQDVLLYPIEFIDVLCESIKDIQDNFTVNIVRVFLNMAPFQEEIIRTGNMIYVPKMIRDIVMWSNQQEAKNKIKHQLKHEKNTESPEK